MITKATKGRMQRALAKSLKAQNQKRKLDIWVLKDAKSNRYVRIAHEPFDLSWFSDPAEASWFETKGRARRATLEMRRACVLKRYVGSAKAYSVSRSRDLLSSPWLLTNKLQVAIGDLGYRLDGMQDEKYRFSCDALLSEILLHGIANIPNYESPFAGLEEEGSRHEWDVFSRGIDRMENGVAAWMVRCALLIARHLEKDDAEVGPGTLKGYKQLVGYPLMAAWVYRKLFSSHIEFEKFNPLSIAIAGRTGGSISQPKLQEWVMFAGATLLEDEMGSDSLVRYLSDIPTAQRIGSQLFQLGAGSVLKSIDDRTHQPKLRSLYISERQDGRYGIEYQRSSPGLPLSTPATISK